jgi:hypothetical protein
MGKGACSKRLALELAVGVDLLPCADLLNVEEGGWRSCGHAAFLPISKYARP